MIMLHVQNTMRMVNALIEANKPFDQAIYPGQKPMVIFRGKKTQDCIYTKKMTSFIEENMNSKKRQ